MNNQSFEEYIRNIIGYPSNNTYAINSYDQNMLYNNVGNTNDERIIKNCYPKIYKLINPMVEKICSQNNSPITETLINDMTNEIYFSLEGENEINININLSNNISGNRESSSNKKEIKNNIEIESNENRQLEPRNPLLNDLIKILIINELLKQRENRPPFNGMRPLRSVFSNNMQPMMPRTSDLYERDYYNNFYEY